MLSVLIELREKKGLAQKALSLELGEVQNFMNMIERRQHGVQFTDFVAICVKLDEDPVKATQMVMDRISPSALRRRRRRPR